MAQMTPEQLEAIRERAEKATEGPWYYALTINENTGEPDVLPHVISDSHEVVAENMYDENAEFIANAREDIPALLAEVERLRREISFIAHVDLLKNAYNAEHIAVSVQSWALNVLDGINHDGK